MLIAIWNSSPLASLLAWCPSAASRHQDTHSAPAQPHTQAGPVKQRQERVHCAFGIQPKWRKVGPRMQHKARPAAPASPTTHVPSTMAARSSRWNSAPGLPASPRFLGTELKRRMSSSTSPHARLVWTVGTGDTTQIRSGCLPACSGHKGTKGSSRNVASLTAPHLHGTAIAQAVHASQLSGVQCYTRLHQTPSHPRTRLCRHPRRCRNLPTDLPECSEGSSHLLSKPL